MALKHEAGRDLRRLIQVADCIFRGMYSVSVGQSEDTDSFYYLVNK